MKFAFILMGGFNPQDDFALIHNGDIRVAGVADLASACAVAKEFAAAGVQCIELCGAFGEEGARAVIKATGGTIPIGYVVHLPEQNALFDVVFGNQ